VRLAVRGGELIKNAEQWFGAAAGFQKCPYLVLAPPEAKTGLEANVSLQRGLGVTTQIHTSAEIADLYPYLDLAGVAVCSLERSAGYADPTRTVQVILASAVEMGLEVHENCEVLGIEVTNGRVSSVLTTEGQISAPVIVNAAGPWADRVARMIDRSYGLQLSREHEAVLEVPATFDECPIVSDSLNSIFFRSHGKGELLLGAGYPKEVEPCDPDTYDDGADDAAVAGLVSKLIERVPSIAPQLGGGQFRSHLKVGWSGVYSITPDWYPIVGADPDVQGYFAAVGGSGHSFKLAPAIGEALADVIAAREPAIDISPLRVERFAEKDTFTSVWGPGNRG
jgi:sarcosine oxidase subunit beta